MPFQVIYNMKFCPIPFNNNIHVCDIYLKITNSCEEIYDLVTTISTLILISALIAMPIVMVSAEPYQNFSLTLALVPNDLCNNTTWF